jgi:hypothetical protein
MKKEKDFELCRFISFVNLLMTFIILCHEWMNIKTLNI